MAPTIGSETPKTTKTRPCLVISNNAQNKKSFRIKAMLDQIRAIDKQRLGKKIQTLTPVAMEGVDAAIKVALSLK